MKKVHSFEGAFGEDPFCDLLPMPSSTEIADAFKMEGLVYTFSIRSFNSDHIRFDFWRYVCYLETLSYGLDYSHMCFSIRPYCYGNSDRFLGLIENNHPFQCVVTRGPTHVEAESSKQFFELPSSSVVNLALHLNTDKAVRTVDLSPGFYTFDVFVCGDFGDRPSGVLLPPRWNMSKMSKIKDAVFSSLEQSVVVLPFDDSACCTVPPLYVEESDLDRSSVVDSFGTSVSADIVALRGKQVLVSAQAP
jgi:hypothetical protein